MVYGSKAVLAAEKKKKKPFNWESEQPCVELPVACGLGPGNLEAVLN